MNISQCNILLADDDADDCIFFQEILADMVLKPSLAIVNNGLALMYLLTQQRQQLPDMIFLDLNMPGKTGNECLLEIKRSEKLKHIPVIIFSTSLNPEVVNLLYETGAYYYIRKPGEYSKLRLVVHQAILTVMDKKKTRPAKQNFVLSIE